MEKDNGIFDDAKLMAFWQERRTDALKALEVADRQIAYLSSLAIRQQVKYQTIPGFDDYGEDY
jgi:hypothetical protein